ncbi:MAG: peptidoglycan DD-metalloendopeptidase family protein [Anaerolineae bacterium]|nr:peptidoglycan DD-metalloendopeptidase family protein [Anaerolineae bacterium]
MLLLLLVIACQSGVTLMPARATGAVEMRLQQPLVTPLPTNTPRPLFASRTPSFTPSLAVVTAAATPLPPTSTPARVSEYLVLGRPILDVGSSTVSRAYPYGGTNGGRLQVHHGVDLVNPIGTPVSAAGDGAVVYAGDDFSMRFAPMTNYYGYLVIIQHNFRSPEGQPVYTLYGHLSAITAKIGQVVHEGDVIGMVGANGIALGPHLHLEIRVGSPFDFDDTRNPELWVRPYPGFGVLAGRVMDDTGAMVYGALIAIQSSQVQTQTYTYGDDSVNPDPTLHENFAAGNLPPGDYDVTVIAGGRVRFTQRVTIAPDRLTWLTVQLPG